jgi:cyanophycinase
MPQIKTDCSATKRVRLIIVLLTVFLMSQVSVAQQSDTKVRPVFDETFLHWPVQLKTNGRVIINRKMTDFKPVDRLLRRVVRGKKVVSFATEKDTLSTKLESLSEKEDYANLDCENAKLQSALTDSNTVYLAENCFSTEELLNAKEQFNNFVQLGGNLIVDASIAEVLGSATAGGKPGLNLIPDCILDCSFDGSESSKQKLAASVATPNRTVGIGIEPEAMLVLTGRRLFSFGNGSTTLAIPASESQTATFQKLSRQRSRSQESTVDLTQWRRMAIDRNLPPFPPEKPKTPFVENGSLYIVGGGGTPKGLIKQMIEEAGGVEKAKCVYIPCSEADDAGKQHRMVSAWKRMGVKHATFIHTKDRNKANSDETFLEPLKDATLLWFGGGRQWNFADSYYGTEAHRLMKEVLHRGGVIGGSSAGASIQGRFLARATPIGNSNILAPGYERGGLGFLSGVAIDQHFSQRGRQKDMTGLVETYPQLLGIGIDESTAIIVRKSRAEVVGRGKVFFYDRTKPVEKGKPDYTAIPKGSVYDLSKREVIDADK